MKPLVVRVLPTQDEVRAAIRLCQQFGHVQQVAYSTYHDALTQVCWSERFARTNLAVPSTEQTDAGRDAGQEDAQP